MEITQEQKKILDSFVCERLTANKENESVVKEFKSKRGAGLVSYLIDHGWEEDKSGKVAFLYNKE